MINAVIVDLRHKLGVVSGTRGSGGSSCLDRSASTENGRDIPRWLCQPGGNQGSSPAVLPGPSRGNKTVESLVHYLRFLAPRPIRVAGQQVLH